LTYRFFPLTRIHVNAQAAAVAALAAGQQGRFWEFHDQLFARQAAWAQLSPDGAQAAFAGIASDLKLDVARWQAEMDSGDVTGTIAADVQKATELQLTGTPTIFIDGHRYTGRFDLDSLSAAVATPS
jgi:protein-disulfide isomerase